MSRRLRASAETGRTKRMWQCPEEWGRCRGRLSLEVGECMRDMRIEASADAADIEKCQSSRDMWAKVKSEFLSLESWTH